MIATTLCVGTISHHHSGFGGGGFALVRLPNGTYDFIDFRESAPGLANETMFVNSTLPSPSLVGGLASGVPGELRGLEELHRRYAKLPWKTLFAPAINYAENGFTVNADISAAGNTTKYPFLLEYPWSIDWAPNGTRVPLGGTMYRKRFAKTLRAIAAEGADAFYRGPRAERIVAAVRKGSGVLTTKDLAEYKIRRRTVSKIEYKGYRLFAGSAPSSGAVALSALKIFEGWQEGTGLKLKTHRLVEGIKFAYGQRTQLGDPDFLEGVEKFQKEMVSAETAAANRAKIQPQVLVNASEYNPSGLENPVPAGGTSHIVTLDADGLAVSLTTTINTFFGSQIQVAEDGIIMNNEMDDFSTPGLSNFFGYLPNTNNYIKPHKRPLSSISPTIVETPDGEPFFIIGAGGGSMIITSVVQNVWNVLERGMDAHTAIAVPHLHDQLMPNLTSFETGYDEAIFEDMKLRGHNATWVASPPGLASAQGILQYRNGSLQAAAETRQHASGGSVWFP
ncbi:gamma-glutamyltranspeptidase [Sphaerosporella brunnea]|uniref:Gamma-glutamyltranspeptidase n=1 Tax=Sphaerosporella brunnea TaxID=1250544 RepID=A0A5J5ERV8_9PEZI|nr:gamma-glutamyltranspeptidase [Sphaerosporella brunnea]